VRIILLIVYLSEFFFFVLVEVVRVSRMARQS